MTNQPEEQNRKLRELLIKLGQSYLERNRYQDAFDKATQLLVLEPENEQALFLAAKAAIALENTSDTALGLYSKALDANLNIETCRELRILLATIELDSPVASKIMQTLDSLNIPVDAHAQEPIPAESVKPHPLEKYPKNEFANKIEGLWWDSKFDEAIKTINANKELNNDFLQKQLALTHAYQSLSSKQNVAEAESIENMLTQLQQLQPGSLDSLREILALTYTLPEEAANANGKLDDSLEFEFILGKIPMEDFFYELQKKTERVKPSNKLDDIIFNDLQKAEEWDAENEIINHRWRGFLATSLLTRGNETPPEKIVKLVTAFLFKIPQSVLRFTGNGFLSFAESPLKQIIAVLNLYKSIDHYNKVAEDGNQIILNSSIVTLQNDENSILNSQSFQVSILKTLHLLQQIKAHTQESHSLYVECQKTLLTELRQLDSDIKYKLHKKICLLPGIKSECYSIKKQQKEDELENDSPPKIQDLKILEKLESPFPFTTYLTKNRQLERTVILKTISFTGKNKNIKKQKEAVLSNIKKIGRLNHPNIATLFDLGKSDEQIYFTREYVEGDNILNFNKSEKDWEINFLTTLEKIIMALQTAANDGIFHLNLKPSNIWIYEPNTLKVTDFDVFQTNSQSSKDIAELKSTLYLAPEVIQKNKVDSRSDIYSLGLIACEVLTGNSPYNTTDDANRGAPPCVELFDNDISTLNQGWVKILRQATQEKPGERFQTLNELEIAIKKLSLELSAETQEV